MGGFHKLCNVFNSHAPDVHLGAIGFVPEELRSSVGRGAALRVAMRQAVVSLHKLLVAETKV